jgi:predicted O-methyltransferase YrrM
MNVDEQLLLLEKFDYADELLAFPQEEQPGLGFYFQNTMFGSGDAEYLYNIIRLFKPRRLIEIGSGQSTRIAAAAISANRVENEANTCQHVCVEPYEADWLEQLDVTVLRTPVEQLDKAMFDELDSNDILFIDSSHMIRPQGDVLHEYLELLPRLGSGVLVHIHDIFTPRDYPAEWIIDQNRFWNEQYLLEAFLSHNSEFKVIGALNFLKHHHPDQISRCCPVLGPDIATREPGSFWIQRV